MRLRNENIFKKVVLFVAVCFVLVAYALACFLVYRDDQTRESVAQPFSSVSQSGSLYLTQAARMQYREHNPADVDRLFRRAILSKPADADSFYAYFSYIKERRCCQERGIALAQEVVKRNPRKLSYVLASAKYLVENGKTDLALSYFRNIEKSPKASRKFTTEMLASGVDWQKLVKVIPPSLLCEVAQSQNDLLTAEKWCK